MALFLRRRGWTEAMQLMKEGAKWELYIPSELGYGDRGAGGAIPGGAVLVFTLELLKVKGRKTIEVLFLQTLEMNLTQEFPTFRFFFRTLYRLTETT